MKKIKHVLALAMILTVTMLLSNCQNTDFEEIVQEEQLLGKKKPDKFIYYRGLKVKKRFKASEKELKVKKDKKSLKALYNRLRKEARKGSKTQGKKSKMSYEIDDEPLEDVELPTPEMLVEAAKVVLNQFPYEEIENYAVIYRPGKEFLDEEMIRDDFSNLSDSEIEANEDIVNDYYSENLDYMVLDEIANNPGTYNGLGTNYQKNAKSNGEIAIALCTINAASDDGYGYVRSAISYLLATDRADDSSTNYYAIRGVEPYNTRRDAYRHMLWNSLLAQYYFTISSKLPRLQFAEFVTNTRESTLCNATQNPIDGRAMDYHNNYVGRKIWNDNTSYRTIFGVTWGLNRSTTSHLKDLVRESVEWDGVFIVKKHPYYVESDPNYYNFSYSTQQTQIEVLNISPNKPVYFEAPIAPARFIASIELETYDCEDNGDDFIPKNSNNTGNLFSIVPDEGGDCFREIIVYTPLYSSFITKDANYNPYQL